jgi:hypothetical protein
MTTPPAADDFDYLDLLAYERTEADGERMPAPARHAVPRRRTALRLVQPAPSRRDPRHPLHARLSALR